MAIDDKELNKMMKSRTTLVDGLLSVLDQKVSEAENALLKQTVEGFIDRLEQDGDGKIKNNLTNKRLLGSIDSIFDKFGKTSGIDIARTIANGVQSVANFSGSYYGMFESEAKLLAIKPQVQETMSAWLGVTKGKVEPNGYLNTIIQNNTVKNEIKNFALRTVVGQQGWQEAKKQLAAIVVGAGDKAGKMKSYYRNFVYDTYSHVDRATGKIYAEKLGFEFYIYEGGIIKTSRKFCKDKNGLVFHKSEIAKFNPTVARPEGYNPFTDLGGYGCRHHLNSIPVSLALVLRPDAVKFLKDIAQQPQGADQNKIPQQTLEDIRSSDAFIDFLSRNEQFPSYSKGETVGKADMINGYCDMYAFFVKKFINPEVKVFSSVLGSNHHTYFKYKDYYYDGWNTEGVKQVEDLHFFKGFTKDKLKIEAIDVDNYGFVSSPLVAKMKAQKAATAPKAVVVTPKLTSQQILEQKVEQETAGIKTAAQAKAYLNTIFADFRLITRPTNITISKDLKGDVLKSYAKQLGMLFGEYKPSITEIENVMMKSTEKTFGFVRSYSYGGLYQANFGDRFDNSRANKYENAADKLVYKGKSTVDKEKMQIATVTHEFAHVLALDRAPNQKAKDFFKEITALKNKYEAEIGGYVSKGQTDKAAEIYLGRYASDSPNEFWAESFAEYKLSSSPSKYAKIVGKLGDKYFKR